MRQTQNHPINNTPALLAVEFFTMKNQTLAIIIIAIAATIAATIATSCENKDNCFHGLASVETEPVEIDTAILYDPKTFEETCYVKRFYMSPYVLADSTFKIEEKIVELVKTDACYQLLSVKQQVANCN